MPLQNFPNIKTDIILAPYTTLEIGGPAEYFYNASKSKELIKLLQITCKEKIPTTILGHGSNVVISDQGIRGLVIRNNIAEINFTENNTVQVSGGFPLPQLIKQAADKNCDSAFLASIPGTVAGAIRGNAGNAPDDYWHGGWISQIFVSARLFDLNSGKIIERNNDWFEFSYRHSKLKKNPQLFLLDATFHFPSRNSEKVLAQIKDHCEKRNLHQPAGWHTCGSVFQNPPKDSAGRLIDKECNLRGKEIGGMKVSEKHANFFENTGNATAQDFLDLANFVIEKVFQKTGTKLRPEFQPLGFDPIETEFLYS